MSQPPQSPWDNPKTPKVCPTGQGWNTFSYNFTHGHPGYICDAGEHFLEADGTRDTEKEAIANSHHKLYLESSAKHRKSAGNSKAQQEALAEFLAPMKKQAIDNTWHALYDLQRKRKNGKAGPRPEKVEEVAHLYERYKLKFPYVGKEKDVPRDASMTMAGPSAQLEFLKEQAAALARAEADKQGQLGGDNRSGKQTDEHAAAVMRIMNLKVTEPYEILGLTGEKSWITKAMIMEAYHKQNLMVDPAVNGHKDAYTASKKVLNAKNSLLPKHKA